MKLTIELVPQTCWYSNVRSNVTKKEWDRLRKLSYQAAGHKCEICKGVGPKHPVECHEIWQYENGIQKLEKLISLCPSCHEVKHIGRSQIVGKGEKALKHLSKVNNISIEEANEYIKEASIIWNKRSQQEWELDISYLDSLKSDEWTV